MTLHTSHPLGYFFFFFFFLPGEGERLSILRSCWTGQLGFPADGNHSLLQSPTISGRIQLPKESRASPPVWVGGLLRLPVVDGCGGGGGW